jgi:hypothetical protein
MTPSIMILSIMTLSIVINKTRHSTQLLVIVMLIVVMLIVVMLSVDFCLLLY